MRTSVQDETERMACRVEEDAEGVPRLIDGFPCTEFDHGSLGDVEVIDDDIDVHLLRVGLPRPAGCVVVLNLLEADRGPGFGCDLCPGAIVIDSDLPVEEFSVELREFTGVGSIDDDDGLLCDSHGRESTRRRC